ncbi:MAG: acetyl-CoA carboxylase biotin carboxyl carrier protein, partial [Gemmata sp.]
TIVTHAPMMAAPAAAPAPAASAPVAPAAAPAAAESLPVIKSPMVGTFYSKPDPKKPDFVSVGSKVAPATTVCTIEAMKTYNPVAAECSGTVEEVCVKSGDFVEYGTVLFRISPS